MVAVKQHSQHTIGVEFSSRLVKLGEKRIKLQVSGGRIFVPIFFTHIFFSFGTRLDRRGLGEQSGYSPAVLYPHLGYPGPSHEVIIEGLRVPFWFMTLQGQYGQFKI